MSSHMETSMSFLALCFGLLLRLVFPIAITLLLAAVLRKLDARWQREAQAEYSPVQRPECWDIKGCSTKQRQSCPVFTSSLPCWQVFRFANGYLRQDCMSCKVFLDAPIPKIKAGPRRV